ncbi:MAG: AMP-binding protein, partial [Pseudomonadota bacterium]
MTWPQGQNAPDPGRFEMSIDTLVRLAAARSGEAAAVLWRDQTISYAALDQHIDCCAATLIDRFAETNADHLAGQRFGISVKKDPANLILFFAILRAGGIAVPLNPALKAEQWAYIAANCDMTAGFVSEAQCEALKGETAWSPIVSGDPSGALKALSDEAAFDGQVFCQCQPKDTAILFYTSGSTGHPKGVMVSHHANVLGAASVGHYLQLRPDDRILTVLPLSFDYGFNQITSSWLAGAAVVLHDYFLASDVPKMVAKSGVTGLAAVPPLWHLLLAKPWPQEAAASLRFVTNSGGTLSQDLQAKMRSVFPNADIYAMYGLTEAFRSTVMPPGRLASKPTSIGQAIPFAKVAAMLP